MTPKEKAIELINKMHNTKHCGIDHFPNKNYCDCSEINFFQAKQCALIAVDEIDDIYQKLTPKDDPYNFLLELEYWQDVKQHIQKL